MGMPIRYSYNPVTTVLGGQQVINMDWNVVPFQASLLVDLVSGSITFGVEYTTDDINKGSPLTWRWLPTAGLPYGTTVNVAPGATPQPQQWTLTFPVTAVRINIQALTGPVNFSVIQGHDI